MSTPRLIEDFAFEAVAGGEGLVVPPTTLDLGIAPANAPNAIVAFGLTTTAGLRAFAVAMGALSPVGEEEPFGLTVVNTSVWPWTATPLVANN